MKGAGAFVRFICYLTIRGSVPKALAARTVVALHILGVIDGLLWGGASLGTVFNLKQSGFPIGGFFQSILLALVA